VLLGQPSVTPSHLGPTAQSNGIRTYQILNEDDTIRQVLGPFASNHPPGEPHNTEWGSPGSQRTFSMRVHREGASFFTDWAHKGLARVGVDGWDDAAARTSTRYTLRSKFRLAVKNKRPVKSVVIAEACL
jgi:hypothetical protein